eukprot:CAMPEP_0181114232 /NCGR_PEP_ID=MMETSP1071-20121207/20767_1 /TAXON_ID=35127 /ORGANISM="Thalassiosira sp., Strain NH16" /LENGTH=761 /DNA_ID=CAMNT_0023198315 /DNA_START=63 /DNA_END=2344 /DNA_ORIENTATION=+
MVDAANNTPATAAVAIIAISNGSPPGASNPVNALGAPVRQYLQKSLQNALQDQSITSIVLIGRPDGKGVFSAGADIKEFSGSNSDSGGVTTSEPGGIPTLNDLAHLIEGASKPIVAALTGACLGGGMELALAAQYRVANDTLKYGLPEVKIGLIPGAGGTQRLPRLCGVRHALDVIVRGRINGTAQEGLKFGLLDGVVSKEETVLECALRWATWASSLPPITLESRRLCCRTVPPDGEGIENKDMCAFALQSLPPKEKGGESAHACLESIQASFGLPSFDEGMETEKNLFNDLLYHSLQGRAYRHIFFAERSSSSSSSSRRKQAPGDQLGKGKGVIGVIGAGTMGRGIAIAFLRAGFGPVILVDVNPKGLKAGVQYIESTLQNEAKKGRLTKSKLNGILPLLESSTNLSKLAGCDLVVEAAFENLKVKREIFSKLNTIVQKREALILSNTSTLDVDAIASSLSPGRRPFCAGMHFFSPAHIMKLVEVVRGVDTSPETLSVIRAITKRIKKVPVVVGNCDGFVGNRMIHPYTTESTLLLVDYGGGKAGLGISDVDAAIGPKFFGMAVGPFVMSDIAGNDIGYNIRREKGIIRDPKTGEVGPNRKEIRYTELADDMVEKMGRVGQKARKGWYNYDPKVGKGRKPLPSSEMQSLIDKYSMNSSQGGKKLNYEEIVHRVLFPLVNEGFKILEEGIASDPSDIDIIYLYGYGWPAWRGGPMFWADNYVGLPKILGELEKFHHMHPGSEYFRPSKLLRECVGIGLGV